MLVPDYYYQSIASIELDELRRRGITTLLLDLDNTLLRRDAEKVTEFALSWIARAREAGFALCIVTNNRHERVVGVAAELGVDLVAKALKPLPFAFRQALARTGSTPAETAVVGDQVFTDILGGSIMKMTTILVTPLSSSDLPHTVVLRSIERRLLAGREPVS